MVGTSSVETAIVIGFDSNSGLPPQITCVQHGDEAVQIILLSRLSGIPIIEDSALGRELLIVQEGDYIPERLWKAVMKILFELIN